MQYTINLAHCSVIYGFSLKDATEQFTDCIINIIKFVFKPLFGETQETVLVKPSFNANATGSSLTQPGVQYHGSTHGKNTRVQLKANVFSCLLIIINCG